MGFEGYARMLRAATSAVRRGARPTGRVIDARIQLMTESRR